MDENKVKIVEDLQPSGSNLPYMKIEDTQYFSKLLVCVSVSALYCLNVMEGRERKGLGCSLFSIHPILVY